MKLHYRVEDIRSLIFSPPDSDMDFIPSICIPTRKEYNRFKLLMFSTFLSCPRGWGLTAAQINYNVA